MAAKNTDEEQIRHVIDTWHRATSTGDVDSVMPLMTEDVVFLTPGNLPVRGRAAFEQGLKNLLKSHSIESRAEVLEMQVDGALAYIVKVAQGCLQTSGVRQRISSKRTTRTFERLSRSTSPR
jgi:uncharacterized protein (TIGR02246 family)